MFANRRTGRQIIDRVPKKEEAVMEAACLRTAYGETLVALGKKDKRIVVLEADLCKSTMTVFFEKEYPDNFFEMGIAEANMAATAAGFSLAGKIPFFASFAAFVPGRCYDQIRTSICIPNLNVKICGSSAGLSDFGDGSTHQSIDDMALMRVLPNMRVFSPCDAVQTTKIVEYMAANNGPMYIRVNRNPLPILTDKKDAFIPGKLYTMREGNDVAIFTSGVTVSLALSAALELEKCGIGAKIINVPSIKPIDEDTVLEICGKTKAFVTVEEHSIYGGLGDAISAIAAPCLARKHVRVGIRDIFGTSAENYRVLLKHYGFVPETIIKAAQDALK